MEEEWRKSLGRLLPGWLQRVSGKIVVVLSLDGGRGDR